MLTLKNNINSLDAILVLTSAVYIIFSTYVYLSINNGTIQTNDTMKNIILSLIPLPIVIVLISGVIMYIFPQNFVSMVIKLLVSLISVILTIYVYANYNQITFNDDNTQLATGININMMLILSFVMLISVIGSLIICNKDHENMYVNIKY